MKFRAPLVFCWLALWVIFVQCEILSPADTPKFVKPLPIPPVLSPTTRDKEYTFYELEMRQFSQNLGLVDDQVKTVHTRVWGYCWRRSPHKPITCLYPGPSIVTHRSERIRIRFVNHLPQTHMFPIDRTFPCGSDLPDVRVAPHLHGGHTQPESDGHPEAWYTPNSVETGPRYVSNVNEYLNDQEPTMLAYHDHALGITRLNVYAGLVGPYFIRDIARDISLGLPLVEYELPLVIQDANFDAHGQLFYPQPAPEEFFGSYILVNGKVWPFVDVQPRVYRLRLINVAMDRFFNVFFHVEGTTQRIPFHIIGSDGGFLTQSRTVDSVLLGNAERTDVLLDFGAYKNQRIVLANDAPTPFPTGDPVDPATTGLVMRFHVGSRVKKDKSPVSLPPLPIKLREKPFQVAGPVKKVRELLLVERTNPGGRTTVHLSPNAPPPVGSLRGLNFEDPVTEIITYKTTEDWDLINLTPDAHPIHLHLVHFQVVGHRRFDVASFQLGQSPQYLEPMQAPRALEQGPKDTVIVPPGTVTRLRAYFDIRGNYVWHCHMLSHEDNDMMRPFVVKSYSRPKRLGSRK